MEEAAEGRAAKEKEVRDVLAMMLFRGDDIYKPMGLLSGGERARVRLAQLLLDKPNVLLLDEPTNHLDIASCEALEGTMQQFAGTILCVSHDRYFLDKVVGRLLVLMPPRMADFAGNYSAWQAKQLALQTKPAAPKQQKPKAQPQPKSSDRASPRKDNPYLRPFGRLTIKELERQIQATEQQMATCQASFADPEIFKDPARSTKMHEEFASLEKKLRQLEAEYFAREQ
jgi:ATP-binding cassette subfamily F protein 3